MRVVIDTNVLVSAFVFGGQLGWLVKRIEEKKLTLIFSQPTWNELKVTLTKQKLAPSQDLIRAILETGLLPVVELGQIYSGELARPSRDLDDDQFLRLALGDKAEALVTGDKDLLVLEGHYPFPILSPADFKARFFFDFIAGEGMDPAAMKKGRTKKKKRPLSD